VSKYDESWEFWFGCIMVLLTAIRVKLVWVGYLDVSLGWNIFSLCVWSFILIVKVSHRHYLEQQEAFYKEHNLR